MDPKFCLLAGDCLEVLKDLPDNSLDSLVTDPPAGISFMGKAWDDDKGGRKQWVSWMTLVMRECLRVMKPGAHGLVWAIPRTSHWMAWALEDAGFEVRDVVTHLFGSGFPKSLDVSKAIDKAAGAERAVVGESANYRKDGFGANMRDDNWIPPGSGDITAPATYDAKKWQGWGTALKPASEHWILIRKPCSEKTVAANVIKWDTGAINVDASRVATMVPRPARAKLGGESNGIYGDGLNNSRKIDNTTQGRFPANLILSHTPYCEESQCDIECAVKEMDRQSGTLKSGDGNRSGSKSSQWAGELKATSYDRPFEASEGGASRFFYVAKASKRDKNAGLEGMEERPAGVMQDDSYKWERDGKGNKINLATKSANFHPTVKSTQLMTYLIRMVTPPDGVVLDPFMGSGTTGVAAVANDFRFLGIEKDTEYMKIAESRIEDAETQREKSKISSVAS